MVFFSPKIHAPTSIATVVFATSARNYGNGKPWGLKFLVSAWLVTTRENTALCGAVTLSIRVWAEHQKLNSRRSWTPGNFCCGCPSTPQLPSANALWDAELQLDWWSGPNLLTPAWPESLHKAAIILSESLYCTVPGPKY